MKCEDALIYCALSWPRRRIAIARGLLTSDPSFAACTYALSDVMLRQAKAQAEAGLAPPPLFRHLLGKFSLAEADGACAQRRVIGVARRRSDGRLPR